MRKRLSLIAAALCSLALAMPAAAQQVTIVSGDLIKIQDDSNPSTTSDTAVYYYGDDGKRYVFPTEKTFYTWYGNFNTVKSIPAGQMAGIQVGGNVTYRPGVKMVKITTDPKTYAVTKNGILRWVKTEGLAVALYGQNWNQMIDDVPDAFFTDYRVGTAIESESDPYRPAMATAMVPTINEDRLLVLPTGNIVDIRTTGFLPVTKTIPSGTTVTWINLSNTAARVASNDHPTHALLPGLDSPTLELGQEYKFQFTSTGTWGYHNHWNPSQTATITVP